MDKEHTIKNIQQLIYYNGADNNLAKTELFIGVDLYYLNFGSNPVHLRHEKIDSIIQINYCKAGQLRWNMKSGSRIYLNYGDYSLHSMQACTQSLMEFPQGFYKGLTICIDLAKLKTSPLKLFGDIFDVNQLCQKFCESNKITSLAGNNKTETIFEGFYNLPDEYTLNYARLKFYELLILLQNTKLSPQALLPEYTAGNEAVIREIHGLLQQNISKRVTIKELALRHHLNTTTLKTAFKNIYGVSIGAYAKEQRLRYAAKLLDETNLSISEITKNCGYKSQSKFTSAFKALFKILPSEYRKRKNSGH